MELLRIGNKLISRNRISRRIDEILEMRVSGKSQQETAGALGVDRTFISRIEALGEVRKGSRVAVVGFPVKNKEEIERAVTAEGVDYLLLFTERERQEYAAMMSGAELANQIMELAAKLKSFDSVVFLGSDMRVQMVEGMIGRDTVIGMELGRSPLTSDVKVDVGRLVEILRGLKS